MEPEQKRALEAARSHFGKSRGEGAVMRLGESSHLDVQVIPTGSLALDVALGVGG
ncbi:MAG: DNA recombination/repair protein RecA, partial [Anaerolineales bacterium]